MPFTLPKRKLALAVATWIVAATAAQAQSPVTEPQRPGGPKLDVDFEATTPVVAKAMLDMAGVATSDVVMDLGCGEGDIALAAVRLVGARSICVELDPLRIEKARALAAKQGLTDKVTFIEGDLFKVDLAPASVITLFLWDILNVRLRPKLLELAPGTRIVSHAHDMGNWQPDRKELHNHTSPDGPSAVYLWIVPARIAGDWTITTDGASYEVKLAQRYQRLDGAGATGKGIARLRSGRVIGDIATLDLIDPRGKVVSLVGRVSNEMIASEAGLQAPTWARAKIPATSPAFRMQRKAPR